MNVTLTPAQSPIQTEPTLSTPVTTAAPVCEPQADSLAQGDKFTHTVKKGDTLWAIAGKKLGDSNKWALIFAQNQNLIKNPDLIYPGQVLTIGTCPAPAQPVPAQPITETPTLPEEPTAPPQPEPPVQETPAPSQPEPPVQEIPIPAQPVAPQPPAQEIPIPANPPAVLQPIAGPQPAQPQKKDRVLRAAVIGGNIGAIGTAGTLIAMTASLSGPAANLGGYATAQKIASGLASIGLKVPQGPALTKMISSVGGPKVAGAAAAVGIGLLVAGAAAGGYYLYTKSQK